MKIMKFIGFLLLCSILVSAEPIPPTNQELFEEQTVVVLGGTGYLGREIVKSVLQYNPKKIIVVSRDEVKQFQLQNLFPSEKVQTLLGDIRDYESVLHATKDADIVFHAAALKRIDLLESNIDEAIKTNVIGAMHVLKACTLNHVKKVLFVSSDKACMPVNGYGATKLMGEKLFSNYDKSSIKTQFISVRFGNISQSTGSIIPILIEKLAKGQEISLTDPAMTRFLMNKEEAVSLLFDALRYGTGGEIFVKVIPSMKISHLIDILKEKFNSNVPVKVVGQRPGEKLAEVLVCSSEIPRTIEFNNYYIIKPTVSRQESDADQPLYERLGKKMIRGSDFEYSSDQNVLTKEELSTILQKDFR
jgi:UDP-N-acetylglucosamine 4,6-dehydratase